MKVKLKNIQEFSENMKYSFAEPFIQIIKFELKHYEGNTQKRLKSFLEEIQRYGCRGNGKHPICGQGTGKLIYPELREKFYKKHVKDLENYLGEPEEKLEELIKYGWPRSTWVLWTSFEQFCSNIYNNIFKNK